MSEETYRLAIVILLALFLAAFVILGARFVENGRYVQYDRQQEYVVHGNARQGPDAQVLDTRTGKKQPPQ